MTELVRRLEDAVIAIRELTMKVEQGYVRKDVYAAEQNARDRRDLDLENDIEAMKRDKNEKDRADAAFRRQVALAGIVAGVGWLVTIVIAIVNFIGR